MTDHNKPNHVCCTTACIEIKDIECLKHGKECSGVTCGEGVKITKNNKMKESWSPMQLTKVILGAIIGGIALYLLWEILQTLQSILKVI